MFDFPSKSLRNAATVLLLLTATSALADEGVLVGELPQGLTTPAVLEKAERALLREDWKILDSDATSLDAKRKDGRNECALTLFVADGTLKYRGTATVKQGWGVGKDVKMTSAEGPIPPGWLNRLRVDIEESLNAPVSPAATAPATNAGAAGPSRANAGTASAPAPTGTTAEKLRELEALRKEGLVSEPEYQRMRQAILDAF